MNLPSAKKFPRMIAWLAISVLLALITYGTMPVTPEPSRWASFLSFCKQANNLTLGGWLCYWLDRSVFYYARPHQCWDEAQKALQRGEQTVYDWLMFGYYVAQVRRAFIVAAGVIAVGIGQ